MFVLHGAIGTNDPIVRLILTCVAEASFELFLNTRSVFGVNSAQPKLRVRRIVSGVTPYGRSTSGDTVTVPDATSSSQWPICVNCCASSKSASLRRKFLRRLLSIVNVKQRRIPADDPSSLSRSGRRQTSNHRYWPSASRTRCSTCCDCPVSIERCSSSSTPEYVRVDEVCSGRPLQFFKRPARILHQLLIDELDFPIGGRTENKPRNAVDDPAKMIFAPAPASPLRAYDHRYR